MNMKSNLWRLSLPIRILMGLCAGLYLLFYILAWGLAFTGDTSLIFDLYDIEGSYPLTGLQIMAGMIMIGLTVLGIILVFLAANRFLKLIHRRGFFGDGIAHALYRLGQSMIVFWVGMILGEDFLPPILTANLPSDLRQEFEWIPFDVNIIIVLMGFVLILTADALRQAREIDQDNKQFI